MSDKLHEPEDAGNIEQDGCITTHTPGGAGPLPRRASLLPKIPEKPPQEPFYTYELAKAGHDILFELASKGFNRDQQAMILAACQLNLFRQIAASHGGKL